MVYFLKNFISAESYSKDLSNGIVFMKIEKVERDLLSKMSSKILLKIIMVD